MGEQEESERSSGQPLAGNKSANLYGRQTREKEKEREKSQSKAESPLHATCQPRGAIQNDAIQARTNGPTTVTGTHEGAKQTTSSKVQLIKLVVGTNAVVAAYDDYDDGDHHHHCK